MNFFNGDIFPNTSNGTFNRSDDSINGVACNVTNCIYHDGKTQCTAKQIHVGPTYANSSADTNCATFQPKKNTNQ